MAGDEVVISPQEVLPVVTQRLLALAEDAETRLAAGAAHSAGHGGHYRREAAWLRTHADDLAQPPTADLVVLTVAAVEEQVSNSRLEGINSKIRVIQRRGYGHPKPAPLIAMIYLCLSGTSLSLPMRGRQEPQVIASAP